MEESFGSGLNLSLEPAQGLEEQQGQRPCIPECHGHDHLALSRRRNVHDKPESHGHHGASEAVEDGPEEEGPRRRYEGYGETLAKTSEYESRKKNCHREGRQVLQTGCGKDGRFLGISCQAGTGGAKEHVSCHRTSCNLDHILELHQVYRGTTVTRDAWFSGRGNTGRDTVTHIKRASLSLLFLNSGR